ncbi:MAG: hypothetical protein AVDCRST_MAG26-4207 [uncultured Chloroflexia bacterium]|uniref:Secreted protein n=1 Tax=uncultured Chloroflexia bacterium TaxID=1672391 RepID=A0A6J4K0B4_9CHLR|nr:MAG: hypothetical protein AVDCRST_MAG26-4207 [uncultured Chloroflexia bacterium]
MLLVAASKLLIALRSPFALLAAFNQGSGSGTMPCGLAGSTPPGPPAMSRFGIMNAHYPADNWRFTRVTPIAEHAR